MARHSTAWHIVACASRSRPYAVLRRRLVFKSRVPPPLRVDAQLRVVRLRPRPRLGASRPSPLLRPLGPRHARGLRWQDEACSREEEQQQQQEEEVEAAAAEGSGRVTGRRGLARLRSGVDEMSLVVLLLVSAALGERDAFGDVCSRRRLA